MQIGSGFGALNILTPNEAADKTYETQINRAKSQLEQATLPDQIAGSQARSQLAQVQLQDARQTAALRQTAAQQAMIANAAATATTPDEWDAQMQELADHGVEKARQFVGRYSVDLQRRLTSAYSAGSPPAALAAMSGQADTATSSPLAGIPPPGQTNPLDAQFASVPPEKLAKAASMVQGYAAAIRRIENAPNPAQQWDREAVAMGHPDQVGQYANGQGLAKLKAEIEPYANYFQARQVQAGAGIPAPKIPADVKEVGNAVVAIDRTDPAAPKVTSLYEGAGTKSLVGTDDQGRGIYVDNRTGAESTGAHKLNAKPAGGGRGSVFEAKRQAWLDAHPNDVQGALDYAGGHRTMTAPQARTAANAQAARDLQALTLAGTPPPDGEAFLKQASDEHFAEIMSAAAPAAPGASGFTSAQSGFEQQYPPDPKATPGSQGRPYYPRTEGDYKRFAPGSYYVGPDGKLRQKPKK